MAYYNLPTGKMTKSSVEYVDAWRELGSKLLARFGLEVIGYDPDFLVRSTGGGSSFNLPLWLVKRMLKEVV